MKGTGAGALLREAPAVGRRLPKPLRGGPRDVVALVVTHEDCDACEAYVRTLEGARADLAAWNGFVRALPGPGAPLVAFADKFGQVWGVVPGGDTHALPGPREVEEWLRFLATQCPE